MKKIVLTLGLLSMFLTNGICEEKKATDRLVSKSEKQANRLEARQLIARLHEIKDIAKAHKLSTTQKTEFRNEVKDIKSRLHQLDGPYIYISASALIIILLLILLL